jgi:hypothetical protein
MKFIASLTFPILPLSTCSHHEVHPSRITVLVNSNSKANKLIAFVNYKFLRRVFCKHVCIQFNLSLVTKIYISVCHNINPIDCFHCKAQFTCYNFSFISTNQNFVVVLVHKFDSTHLANFPVSLNEDVVSILRLK